VRRQWLLTLQHGRQERQSTSQRNFLSSPRFAQFPVDFCGCREHLLDCKWALLPLWCCLIDIIIIIINYYYTWILLWWRCHITAAGPPYNVTVTFRRLNSSHNICPQLFSRNTKHVRESIHRETFPKQHSFQFLMEGDILADLARLLPTLRSVLPITSVRLTSYQVHS